ncbi:hypothetical protein [Paenibacillus sp. 1P07SE]|uniref:hypothetical protein n=1 Tax=Paenibacillus sp. 1P07SE TaxID=3132209 RepID=UPI0039A5A46E
MRLILFMFLVLLVGLMVYLRQGRSRLRELHDVLERHLVELTSQADDLQTFIGLVQGATRKRAQGAEDRLLEVTAAVTELMNHIQTRQLGLGQVFRQGREIGQCERQAAELQRAGRELTVEIAQLRKLESRVRLRHEELLQELYLLKTRAGSAERYREARLPRLAGQLESLDNDLQAAGELAFFDPLGADERMTDLEDNMAAVQRQIRKEQSD